IGVANTRARIQQLYGERYGLTLEDAPGGGVIARVELPFVVLNA
ncbi:sensor histidine kinase, partial [Myxococcus sp. CA039A]|nr:sensor histidine kinase [Myxococcus sp. CA039A]